MINWLYLFVVWMMLFWGLKYGLTVVLLMKSRFRRIGGSVVSAAEVPDYLRELLTISAANLEQLGFRNCGYIKYSPFLQRSQEVERWFQVLVDASGSHFAAVDLRYPTTAQDPFAISFYTWFNDRHLLVTVDRLAHAILGPNPNITLGDTRIRNLDRQWDYHRQQFAKLNEHRQVVSDLDINSFCDRYFGYFDDYIDQLVGHKTFLPPDANHQYRIALFKAFVYAYQLIYRLPKAQPLAKPITLPVEIAIDNAKILDQSQTLTSSRKSKFWWFALSAIAFYVVTIPTMGWQFGVQLSIVILLHELGHLLSMQLFGYQNTSMFLIPFFGGAATGQNENATLLQKFWVLILGPLPGILLGIVMLSTTSYGNSSWYWSKDFALLMVGINLLNLLPIYPLDGGKIVGLLLQPCPYISVGFKLICTVLSIAWGLAGSHIFLFIGIAIAASLPVDLQTARAIKRLKTQPGAAELTKDEWVKWAYDRLDAKSQPPAKPAHQKLFMNNLWEWRSDLHNSPGIRWSLGLLYTFTLIGGTIGSAYGLIGNKLPLVAGSYMDDIHTKNMNYAQRTAYYQTKWRRDLQSTTALIKRDPNNIQAYRQQLRLHRLLKDDHSTMQDLNRLITLQTHDSRYLHERLFLNQKLQQYQAALLDTDRLLQINPQSKADLYHTRGNLYVKLGKIDLAIDSYSHHLMDSTHSSRQSAYLERSKLYAQKGEQKLALADLDLAIASEPKYAAAAYVERAKFRDQSGDRAGAKLDRQKATELETKNREDNED
jgi:Zn-dependent protease